MPNSLKVKLSKLRHKGQITNEEYQELIVKLDGHDEKIRADERRKFIAFIAEHTHCRTDCENFLNCDGKRCWNKYLDMYEKEQK